MRFHKILCNFMKIMRFLLKECLPVIFSMHFCQTEKGYKQSRQGEYTLYQLLLNLCDITIIPYFLKFGNSFYKNIFNFIQQKLKKCVNRGQRTQKRKLRLLSHKPNQNGIFFLHTLTNGIYIFFKFVVRIYKKEYNNTLSTCLYLRKSSIIFN